MTAQQFVKKYPDSEINDNCLQDIACPQCGARNRFIIQATSSFVMSDSGTDEFGDVEYDNDNYVACDDCGHDGKLSEFRIDGLDDLLRQAADHDAEQTEAFNKYGMQV